MTTMDDGTRLRLWMELTQLRERTEDLDAFILSDGFKTLPEVDQADLHQQLGYMLAYGDVLSRRHARFKTVRPKGSAR